MDLANGIYDLHIKNTTYDKDNGAFECRSRKAGSEERLHKSTLDLVVLLAPGEPRIAPTNPILTEGKQYNLTCSSTGN